MIENSRRVTHGCIIASLRLFHSDGNEAVPTINDSYAAAAALQSAFELSGSVSNHNLASISTLNLYQLAQCLKEALDREEALQSKMIALQQVLQAAQEQADHSWHSLVEEDRMLSRIESLQSKLEALINSTTNKEEESLITSLRYELLKMHEEREAYEWNAKTSIRRAAEQTLITGCKLNEVEVCSL